MPSQQLVDFIHDQLKTESKLSVVCERVMDRCLAPSTSNGEGCDNMTMIIVQFKKPIYPAAEVDSPSNYTNTEKQLPAVEPSETQLPEPSKKQPVEPESSSWV